MNNEQEKDNEQIQDSDKDFNTLENLDARDTTEETMGVVNGKTDGTPYVGDGETGGLTCSVSDDEKTVDTDMENSEKKERLDIHKKSKKKFHKKTSIGNSKEGNKNYKNLISQAMKVPVMQVATKLGLPITQKNTTKCINPSHFDKSSSMSFNEKTNRYECFSCGTSGSTVDMVRSILRVTKNKAAEWILDRVEDTEEYKKFIPEDRKKGILTGTSQENQSSNLTYKKGTHVDNKYPYSKEKRVVRTSDHDKDKFYEDRSKLIKSGEMQRIYKNFTFGLTPLSKIMIGIGFIKDKQIRTDTTDDLGIGVILNTEGLEADLKKKYDMEKLYLSGLYTKKNNSHDMAFTFKEHSVIFPYVSGKSIVYLQGRRLDSKDPLYATSTKEQPFIYNYNILRDLKETQSLVICDDVVESVSLIDKGFNAISVVNAHRFKSDWVKNISSNNIVLLSDNSKIQKRIGSIFLKEKGINIKLTNYDKIISVSKKHMDSVCTPFKKVIQNGDEPFWMGNG